MWTAGKRQDDVSLTAHMISVFRSPHPYETDKAMWLASVVFIVIQLCPLAVAFFPGLTNQKAPAVDLGSLEYVSPAMNGVQEGACLDTANRIQLLPVKVAVPSTAIRNDEVEDLEDGKVGISFAHWPSAPSKQRFPLPLILVHGFDSSCLEYRSTFGFCNLQWREDHVWFSCRPRSRKQPDSKTVLTLPFFRHHFFFRTWATLGR